MLGATVARKVSNLRSASTGRLSGGGNVGQGRNACDIEGLADQVANVANVAGPFYKRGRHMMLPPFSLHTTNKVGQVSQVVQAIVSAQVFRCLTFSFLANL